MTLFLFGGPVQQVPPHPLKESSILQCKRDMMLCTIVWLAIAQLRQHAAPMGGRFFPHLYLY